VVRATKLYERALAEASKSKPDLGKAFLLLQRAEREGDPRASYAMGTWFLHGHHVHQDRRKGIRLIRAAATANVALANLDLGVSLELGEGIKKNDRMAAEAYLRAALYGDTDAVFEVGRCLYYGIGFPRDRRTSRIWLSKAKELGVYEAEGKAPRKKRAQIGAESTDSLVSKLKPDLAKSRKRSVRKTPQKAAALP
jgi:uncharacterized protein